MPVHMLMCDVDMAEEAELRRLEGRGSPRELALRSASALPCSPRSEHGANADVEEGMDVAPHLMPQAVAALASLHSPAPVASAPSAAPHRNSTVEAARKRVRGPTVTEQRLRAAEDAVKADAARKGALKARAKSAKPASEQDAALSSVGTGKCVKLLFVRNGRRVNAYNSCSVARLLGLGRDEDVKTDC